MISWVPRGYPQTSENSLVYRSTAINFSLVVKKEIVQNFKQHRVIISIIRAMTQFSGKIIAPLLFSSTNLRMKIPKIG